MNKILIAMDSYKGTLSSLMLANIIKSHYPIKDASFTVLPISDGGEGFVDAIAYSIQHKQIDLYVEDAFGNVIPTKYIIDDHETAIMELALSSGLGMIEEKYRNPLKTSSYGLGQTMIDALNRGVKKMIIGLGGSSTNDGGAGMLKAIGVRFYDDHHHEIERLNGQTISMISSIDFHEIDARFKEVDIQVACDVRNPLLGPMGATQVYARQKGAKECQVNQLERDMMHFAKVVHQSLNKDDRLLEGAGAAGGLGFALSSFLHAKLVSGFDILANLVNLEDQIRKSHLIITGEGKFDDQSFNGKVPVKIAEISRKYKKTVIGIFGQSSVKDTGHIFDKTYSIVPKFASREEALRDPQRIFIDFIKNFNKTNV
ncbi:glycerate kinase [Mycoplasmatota bacterium]|nr:glycerate kinase [Mycoplasmatota bacterium]